MTDDVIEIHCTPLPVAGMAMLTLTVPGQPKYLETFRSHPENLGEAALKLLRRVANDYAALLVKSSTTHEAPEVTRIDPQLVKLQNQLGDTQDERNEYKLKYEAAEHTLDNLTRTNAKLHEDLKWLRRELDEVTAERDKLKAEAAKSVNMGHVTVSCDGLKEALDEYEHERAMRKDDLLRAALRVVADYV